MRFTNKLRNLWVFFFGGVPGGGATVAVPVPIGGRGVGAFEVSGKGAAPASLGEGGSLGMSLDSMTGCGVVAMGSEGIELVAVMSVGVFRLWVPGTTVSSIFLASANCRRYYKRWCK